MLPYGRPKPLTCDADRFSLGVSAEAPALGVRCAEAMPVAHKPKTIPRCKRRLKPLEIEVLHSTAHGGQSSNRPTRLTWLTLPNTGAQGRLGHPWRRGWPRIPGWRASAAGLHPGDLAETRSGSGGHAVACPVRARSLGRRSIRWEFVGAGRLASSKGPDFGGPLA